MTKPDPRRGCCITCDEEYRDELHATHPEDVRWIVRPFIICPTCGNKRCPKATHHRLDCTGSNEPGQPGSAYPAGKHYLASKESLTTLYGSGTVSP